MQIYTEYEIYSDRFLRELILLKRTQQLPRLKQKKHWEAHERSEENSCNCAILSTNENDLKIYLKESSIVT